MKAKDILKKLSIVAAMTAIFTAAAVTAHAADATLTGTGTVVTPISITNTAGLSFGRFIPHATNAGTVTIDTADARTYTQVSLLTGGTITAAKFTVSGQGGFTYSLTVPADITMTSGANNMTAHTGAPIVTGGGTLVGTTGTLPAGGSHTLVVGGTVDVAAAQTSGDYSGSVTVTVNYN